MTFAAAIIAAILALPPQDGLGVTDAAYVDETTRYSHGILGDAIEYGALILFTEDGPRKYTLPENRVFEDLAPRLADLDGDGDIEVIVIETDVNLGASLAIYNETGKIAATPFLGRSHRWLAPIGIADFNGDGVVDIAYIEKPHLAKILKIVSFENGSLRQIMEIAGLTNHRIGEDFISGGVRVCGGAPEMITVDANWQNIISTQIIDDAPVFTTIGRFTGQQSLTNALAC